MLSRRQRHVWGFIIFTICFSMNCGATRLISFSTLLRPGRDLSEQRMLAVHDGQKTFGSGNIVHNLYTYAWGRHLRDPYDWALRFERAAKDMILARDHKPLINYEALGPDAALSIPTPDHYLPLLYVLGTQQEGDGVRFPVVGVDGGSISMLAVQIG